MNIALATPVGADSAHGNGVTTRRWAGLLRELGHDVTVTRDRPPASADLLVALHARKSAPAVRAFAAARPGAPIVLALTGTDLYPDLDSTGVEAGILERASRLVVLQPAAVRQLPAELRDRARVILQSVPPVPARPPRDGCFEVAFLAHVRPVKDPMCLAAATRLLPASSRVRVTHLGEARDQQLARRLAAEAADNPRYRWLGPCSREEALRVLARSRLLALTSLHEGGANVVSEALAAGVPVASSRIPGSLGLLGEDYPGYFPPGDPEGLANLLDAVERDARGLHQELRQRCARLRPVVDPSRERRAWQRLLAELAPGPARRPGSPDQPTGGR